jgi:methyl-accepting chemotaxis protein
MTPLMELIIDGILAVLLISVIIVCNIVYRRLQTIRDGQTEMRELMDSLNVSVLQAQKSVKDISASSNDVEERIGNQVAKASKLVDELTLITEAGNNLADRIDRNIANYGSDKSEAVETTGKQQKEILAALKEAR